ILKGGVHRMNGNPVSLQRFESGTDADGSDKSKVGRSILHLRLLRLQKRAAYYSQNEAGTLDHHNRATTKAASGHTRNNEMSLLVVVAIDDRRDFAAKNDKV